MRGLFDVNGEILIMRFLLPIISGLDCPEADLEVVAGILED